MQYLLTFISSRLRDERGQTMAEYAVVLGLITLAIVGAIGLLGGQISAALNSVQAQI